MRREALSGKVPRTWLVSCWRQEWATAAIGLGLVLALQVHVQVEGNKLTERDEYIQGYCRGFWHLALGRAAMFRQHLKVA
jgi:hypothetical protein